MPMWENDFSETGTVPDGYPSAESSQCQLCFFRKSTDIYQTPIGSFTTVTPAIEKLPKVNGFIYLFRLH